MEAHNKKIRAKANIWLLETVWASEEELHPGRPGLSPGEGLERQAGPRAGPAKRQAGQRLGWAVLKLPAGVVVRGPSPQYVGACTLEGSPCSHSSTQSVHRESSC